MQTLFIQERFQRFPVPLLACERLSFLLNSRPPEYPLTEEEIHLFHVRVLRDFCGIKEPSNEDIEYLVNRLRPAAVGPSEPSQKPRGSSFGKAFNDLLSRHNIPDLLLAATGFDLEKARYLYTIADKDHALWVVNTWISFKAGEHNMRYEAAVYGAGGHYADDKTAGKGGSETIDASTEEGFKRVEKLLGTSTH